jgi:hypothetical protein
MKGVEWIRKREVASLVLSVIVTVSLVYLASLGHESREGPMIGENGRVALCEWLNFVTSVKGKVLAAAMIATGLLSWLLARREGPNLSGENALLWMVHMVLSRGVVLGTVFLFFFAPYSPAFAGPEYTPGMDCQALRGR